jgi:hypothetical protein
MQLRPLPLRRAPGGHSIPFGPKVGLPTFCLDPATAHPPSLVRGTCLPHPGAAFTSDDKVKIEMLAAIARATFILNFSIS